MENAKLKAAIRRGIDDEQEFLKEQSKMIRDSQADFIQSTSHKLHTELCGRIADEILKAGIPSPASDEIYDSIVRVIKLSLGE